MKKFKSNRLNLLHVGHVILFCCAAAAPICLNACATRTTSKPAPAQTARDQFAAGKSQTELPFLPTSIGNISFDECGGLWANGVGFQSSTGESVGAASQLFESHAAVTEYVHCHIKDAQKVIARSSIYDEGGKQTGERLIISVMEANGVQATGRVYVEIISTNDTLVRVITGTSLDTVLAFERWRDATWPERH
jgi:hypothetical protein